MRSRSKTKKPKKEMDEERSIFRILRDLQYAENDARTVYVGNVHFGCSPEEVRRHFESCGTVSEMDIKTDDSGKPKGIAFVEFLEVEAVEKALLLNESQLRGRQIKVGAKWKKVPRGAGGKVKRPESQRPPQLN